MKYRKKAIIIDAIQFTGDNYRECKNFIKDDFDNTLDYPNVRTLSGTVNVEKNDFIIRGIKGEIYPCKPDIFEATYEII